MDPGKLNKRLQIYRFDAENVKDGAGGYFEDGWVLFKEVWGSIEPLSAKEFEQAQQLQVEITHKITIRHDKDIKRDMKIKYKDRTFDIQYILDKDEKRNYLEIRAVENL